MVCKYREKIPEVAREGLKLRAARPRDETSRGLLPLARVVTQPFFPRLHAPERDAAPPGNRRPCPPLVGR